MPTIPAGTSLKIMGKTVSERRHFERVRFGRGYTAKIMAIDGTWERACKIGDASDTGAKVIVQGSIEGIDLREFFLMLSPTGGAHRRCERIWLNGEEIGVRFLKDQPDPARKRWKPADDHDKPPPPEAA